MQVRVTVTVNGTTKTISTNPQRSILDVLRDDLKDTGTPHRCGAGRCGGCVVLLDDRRVLACDVPIVQADGRTINSI
jgi:aerobic-type carbon monoxide dehydrogenase small subunit (CoxS/CutS family)